MSSSQKWEKEKTYKLDFTARAYKELFKLPEQFQSQLVNKLKERLKNPRVEKDKLSGMPDCYKIKLKSAGYRLVYSFTESSTSKWWCWLLQLASGSEATSTRPRNRDCSSASITRACPRPI